MMIVSGEGRHVCSMVAIDNGEEWPKADQQLGVRDLKLFCTFVSTARSVE